MNGAEATNNQNNNEVTTEQNDVQRVEIVTSENCKVIGINVKANEKENAETEDRLEMDIFAVCSGPELNGSEEEQILTYNSPKVDGKPCILDFMTRENDHRTIQMDLSKVPATVNRVVIGASLYKMEERRQNFGMLEDIQMNVYNAANDEDIATSDMPNDEELKDANGLLMTEFNRTETGWAISPVAIVWKGGNLKDIAPNYQSQEEKA